MRNNLFIAIAIVLMYTRAAQAADPPATAPASLPDTVLLFSSFQGHSETGLHLAWSADGLTWTQIEREGGYIIPKVGSEKLMRDPCLHQGPDGTFHLVWTTGWRRRDIGYASSKDLIKWSEQKVIPVMEHEPTAMNCWAPEIIYDDAKQQYLIFWATTIPGRFPETDKQGREGRNHRIYSTTTKDFQTFTQAKLFFNPGHNVIDATIVRDGKRFIMIYKDETAMPVAKKYLLAAESDNLEGPYKTISEPFTISWVEGPSVIKLDEWFVVYFDMYRASRYGAMRSKDLKVWEDITEQLSITRLTKHGTVLRVKKQIVQNLLDSASKG